MNFDDLDEHAARIDRHLQRLSGPAPIESQPPPAPETGEWRVEALPTHGWRVVDATGQEIVADVYRKEDAEQIVSDHNAVPRLVEVINDAISQLEDHVDNALAVAIMLREAQRQTLTTLRRSG